MRKFKFSKFRKFFLAILMIMVMSLGISSIKAVNYLDYFNYHTQGTNVTSVSKITKNAAIPSDYTFGLGENYKATAYSGGVAVTDDAKNKWQAAVNDGRYSDGAIDNLRCFTHSATEASSSVKDKIVMGGSKEVSMLYKQVGTYNGKSIDVRVKVKDYSINTDDVDTHLEHEHPYILFLDKSSCGGANQGRLGVYVGAINWIGLYYEFLISGTNTPINVKGYTTYWDVDWYQGIRFFSPAGLYSTSNSILKYKQIPADDKTPYATDYVFDTTNDAFSGYKSKVAITETFSGASMYRIYTFTRQDKEDDQLTGRPGAASGEIWNTAIVNTAKKEYSSDTPAGLDHAPVKIGDVIKYKIKYTNGDDDGTASVVITDKLSKGLQYQAGTARIGSAASEPTITNNSDGTTTLRWTTSLAAGSVGELTYSVKVTNLAVQIVQNDAFVTIGDHDYDIAPLKNPIPTKTYAPQPNAGYDHAEVKAGDDIKYSIKLANVRDEEQVVTITDHLSKGLDYNNDATITNATITSTTSNKNDETGETSIVWVLKVPASTANVNLLYSAKVNADAKNLVNNNATAKYGNDPVIQLAELHNPINVKEYASDTPYGLNGSIVQKGDTIKYKVSYANPYDNAENIVIKDIFSKGLEYQVGSAQVCNELTEQRTCEKIATDKESVTKNTDGTTTVLWTRDSVAKYAVETIEYTVKVTGETIKVQNNAWIKYGNRPEVNINELKNPVPTKEYDKDTPSGYDQTAVAKGNRIRYSIKYVNVADEKITATIKDTISKGIVYIKGTSKIGNESIGDPTMSKDGKTLTWSRELDKDQEETLTYEVMVTGETLIVNNKATMIYSNNPEVERFLNKLYNPVPRKTYAKDTKAGKNGATVKKGDVITYSIKYNNVKDLKQTIIITDHLSKGLKYRKGTAKINGKAVEPDSVTTDANGTMLIWMTELEAGGKAELVYGARVTGTKMLVENNADIQYGHDPVIHLDELRNPLVPKTQVVKIPNTGSSIAIAGIVAGIALISCGAYVIYSKSKHA